MCRNELHVCFARLAAWGTEKVTNRCKLAHLADRCIALLVDGLHRHYREARDE